MDFGLFKPQSGPEVAGGPSGLRAYFTVPSDPNGIVRAPKGQRAYLVDGMSAWDNVDGERLWRPVGAGDMGVVSMWTYGGRGDGTSDNAAALTAAIAGAHVGDLIWFPPGDYRFASEVVCTKAVSFGGVGIGSRLYADGDFTLLLLSGVNNVRVQALTLFSRNTSAAQAVLSLQQVHGALVDVGIWGGRTGLRMVGCLVNKVRLQCSGSLAVSLPPTWVPSAVELGASVIRDNAGDVASNGNMFENPRIEGCSVGVSVSGQPVVPSDGGVGETDSQFVGGTIEGNGTGVILDGCWQPTVFEGVHCEGNAVADVQVLRSANVVFRDQYLGSAGPVSVSVENSHNVGFENSYVRRLAVDSASSGVKARNCVIRILSDDGVDTDVVSEQYLQTGALPYGVSDSARHGRVEGIKQTLLVGNQWLQDWGPNGLPIGFSAVGGATVVKEAGIFYAGSCSAKVTAPYAPSANSGLRCQLPASMSGHWVTLEVWTYSSAPASVLVGVKGAATVCTMANSSPTINAWIRHRVSVRCPAGTSEAMVYVGQVAPNAPTYVGGFKILGEGDSLVNVETFDRRYAQTGTSGADTSLVDTDVDSILSRCGIYDLYVGAARWNTGPEYYGCYKGTLLITGDNGSGKTRLTLIQQANDAGVPTYTLTVAATWYDTVGAVELGTDAVGSATTFLRFKIGAYAAGFIGQNQRVRLVRQLGVALAFPKVPF
jgi:hypothetical protein